MPTSILLNLGSGDLQSGFPRVTATLWSTEYPLPEQWIGELPPAPHLATLYREWQLIYQSLCNRKSFRKLTLDDELEIETEGVTNVSQRSFQDTCQQLQKEMNRWLDSEAFRLLSQSIQSRLDPTAEIRVVLETNDPILRRIPWQQWNFFQHYPNAELSLSQPEYQRRGAARSKQLTQKVRILAIIGNCSGIDVEAEAQFLKSLQDADVTFLVNPSQSALHAQLGQTSGWDILFFAGHSQTEGEIGRIYLNDQPTNNSLTLDQLKEDLQAAIDHGLKLAIFNSCDGLGLALALERVRIPVVMVMREAVPNRVAQQFFNQFLKAFAIEKMSLYLAVRQARHQLQELEGEFPGASWLPVICQNPAAESPTWFQLGGMPSCPYRGLFAFQEEDADLFFGREQVTQQLVKAVRHQSLVAVVGASGSGKSSLVLAGLLPELRKRSLGHNLITMFRPGNNPFKVLAEALLPLLKRSSSSSSIIQLESELRSNPNSLTHIANSVITSASTEDNQKLIIVVDQFEELYTQTPEADYQLFLNQLLEAVQSCSSLSIILTLRADFYGYAVSYRPLSDALQGAVYNLGPMSREELQRAIAQPAAQMQVRLEPGLTEKLIQATWGQAGRLPLLEFALTELWSQQQAGWLTHQAYDAMGGVEEALANHAERIYAQLHPIAQQRVQRIFVQLVEPGIGTDSSRRLATRDEVGEGNWDLVSHLASSRLVVTNRNETTGEETVEIVHETLIRSWERLESWLRVDDEFRRWQEDLRRARQQWRGSDREDEALLRGKRLSDAQYWYDSRQDELSSGESQFIQYSLDAQNRSRERRKRRRQALILSLIAGFLGALLLSGIAWWQGQKAYINEIRAIAVSSKALFSSNQELEAITASLKAGQLMKTLPLVEPNTQAFVTSALKHILYRIKAYNRLEGHGSAVYAVSISPDHQIIATASQDKTVRLWQQNGTLLNTLRHNSQVYTVAFSPDSQIIVSGDEEGIVKLWQRDGHLVATLNEHKAAVKGSAFSHNGKMLATASWDGTLKLWNRTGTLIKTFTQDENYSEQTTVAFSPNDEIIAAGGWRGTVKLWQLDGTLLTTLTADKYSSEIYKVAFSHDGKMIATASDDGTIKLWKPEGTKLGIFTGHSAAVKGIAFSPDDQTIASASADRMVKLWKPDGTLLNTLHGHGGEVYDITFSPDGQTIASASEDKTVRLWKPNGTTLKTFSGYSSSVYSVSISPNKQTVATADGDKLVKLWNVNGALRSTLKGHTDRVFAVSFSPDGQRLASGDGAGTIKLWKSDGTLLKDLHIDNNHEAIRSVSFSSDGQRLASSGDDTTVKLWQQDGTLLKTLSGHQSQVWAVRFSPNDQMIVSGSVDGTIILWDRSGSQLKVLSGGRGAVYSVTFSPDSQIIASAHEDGTVKLWNRSGTLLKTLAGKDFKVYSVLFSPDGKTLATASEDGTVKFWGQNGTLLKTLDGHEDEVWSLSLSTDGKILASASKDRTVILWDMERALNLEELLPLGCTWARDYLKTNPKVSEPDRHLCDGIRSEQLG